MVSKKYVTVLKASMLSVTITVVLIWMLQAHLRLYYLLFVLDIDSPKSWFNDEMEVVAFNVRQERGSPSPIVVLPNLQPRHDAAAWLVLTDDCVMSSIENHEFILPSSSSLEKWKVAALDRACSVTEAPWSVTEFSPISIPPDVFTTTTVARPHYRGSIHLINILPFHAETTAAFEASTKISKRLRFAFETNLHFSHYPKPLVDIRIKRYDWPMEWALNSSITEIGAHYESIVSSFIDRSFVTRDDIFVLIAPVAAIDAEPLRILSTNTNNYTNRMYMVLLQQANEDGLAVIASLARSIVRRDVLTSSMVSLVAATPTVPESFATQFSSSLSQSNVSVAELRLEAFVRESRVKRVVTEHMRAVQATVLAAPWKLLALPLDSIHRVNPFVASLVFLQSQARGVVVNVDGIEVGSTWQTTALLQHLLDVDAKAEASTDTVIVAGGLAASSRRQVDVAALEAIATLFAEVRSFLFVAVPTLSSLPQYWFVVFGPFWFPLMVPVQRLMSHAIDIVFAT